MFRIRRPRSVVVAALGIAAVAVFASASPASAHATLESTSPEQGSEVQSSPAGVSLRFSEPVGIGPRAIQVLDAGGRRVDDGSPSHPAGRQDAVQVGLREQLPRGSYTVVWRVVSADSHPIAGTFSFGVAVAAGTTTAVVQEDRAVAVADAGLRGLAYLGAVVLVGGLVFLVVLWPAGLALQRSRVLLAAGWLTSGLAAAGLFLVQGPYGAGVGLGALTDPQLIEGTLESRYGKLMLLRLLVLALAVPPLRRQLARVRTGSGVDLAALGTVFVLTFSLSEHAGQGDLVALAVPADAVHLASACVWIGGLVVLSTALLVPRVAGGLRDLDDVLPAWSRTAMTAVVLLVVTGTFQAWRGLGSWAALTGTTYGQLVLAKVAGLAVLLVLADQGRRWIRRRTSPATVPTSDPPPRQSAAAGGAATVTRVAVDRSPTVESVARLRAGVLGEVGVAAVVLGLTTALVSTVPGVQAYAPPYSATLTATSAEGSTLTVLLDVDSTRAGATTVHLYTYTPQGAVAPYVAAAGRMTTRGDAAGPVRFRFTPTGPGHGTADGVVVPGPGRWTLSIDVQTDASTDYAATTTYEVR